MKTLYQVIDEAGGDNIGLFFSNLSAKKAKRTIESYWPYVDKCNINNIDPLSIEDYLECNEFKRIFVEELYW